MQAKNTNKMRQFSSLLNEHWKRKQRLKGCCCCCQTCESQLQFVKKSNSILCNKSRLWNRKVFSTIFGTEMNIKTTSSPVQDQQQSKEKLSLKRFIKSRTKLRKKKKKNHLKNDFERCKANPNHEILDQVENFKEEKNLTIPNLTHLRYFLTCLIVFLSMSGQYGSIVQVRGQQTVMIQSDPKPTIYSGQVSFGLLLSAHSSLGSELSSSASYQVKSVLALEEPNYFSTPLEEASTTSKTTTTATTSAANSANFSSLSPSILSSIATTPFSNLLSNLNYSLLDVGQPITTSSKEADEDNNGEESRIIESKKIRKNRQIFDRATMLQRRQQQQQQHQQKLAQLKAASNSVTPVDSGLCSQVNANALFAGMGAIWASHQANLVADNHLNIGTYVYDSCNDLDIGQRQSVRIVSNLNAFQQTTCESPRGAPISLTIAHGDNQLSAIQLLTSFRLPVITTKEHFDLEDYSQLSKDQKKFLFSTAPSSRHLAVGALKFSKRIVARSTSSHNLPNHSYKSSPKNGLIIVSTNLPGRFINYLKESIPIYVNYEMMLTGQPIDQIKSLDALENNFKQTSSTSESRTSTQSIPAPSSSSGGNYLEDEDAASSSSSTNKRRRRKKRDDSSGEDDSSDSDADGRMLSPTILMFITPSEAIDLVTRLRNDLAEVSRFYSLIVTTREDISPALKTIFHRGGSRLCSGKAFYAISPKPDDISEFSRYFRDTVQMEGELSDHPLITEFAKYQSSTKINADLDEISTEPIIKAVWSAAAAFKLVHSRRCGSFVSNNSPSAGAGSSSSGGGGDLSGDSGGANSATTSSGGGTTSSGRIMNGRQSGKSGYQECMIKMNKEMASLVQRELKRLDVTINSTGLQSLDDRRLRFDDVNELVTNKFSIKYINKECEITEIGEYMGMRDSALKLNDGMLIKSLESTLPDPWPIRPAPPPSTPAPVHSTTASSSSTSSSKASSPVTAADTSTNLASSSESSSLKDPNNSDSGSAGLSDSNSANESGESGRGKRKLQSINDEDSDSDLGSKQNDDDEQTRAESDSTKSGERASAELMEQPAAVESPVAATMKRTTRKRSRFSESTDRKLSRRNNKSNNGNGNGSGSGNGKKNKLVVAPVTAMGGRGGIMPGVTDTEPVGGVGDDSIPTTISGDRTTSAATTKQTINTNSAVGGEIQHQHYNFPTVKPMRKLKSFTTSEGTKLEDWLPSTGVHNQNKLLLNNVIQPTRVPTTISTSSLSTRLHDDEQVDSGGSTASSDLKMRGTTEAPVFSTLPESGGNTDLDAPAIIKSQTRITKSTKSALPANNSSLKPLEVAATVSTETATDYVTSPSISKNSFDTHSSTTSVATPTLTRQTNLSNFNFADQIRPMISNNQSTNSRVIHENDSSFNRLNHHFKDLISSPIPLDGHSQNSLQGPENLRFTDQIDQQGSSFKSSSSSGGDKDSARTQSHRSHLKWIYSSWFGVSILGANICGALLTLYVLTFLLMKNCDGSLDRENQGMRSMHLLAIIIVFFGSTLFIVYPTPGLCLLRTSWHNFALVMLFGSLLLHAMQVRSLSSLGLGGRPNKLNQFLTLLFMVGVQVSFELQRWKYESANYMNFVSQYFGSSETNQKLSILSSAIANQFNPLNAFNDQITPVSIQVSEHYQNLLHDYCTQRADDFIASQIYLCLIVGLLVIFSASTRKNSNRRLNSSSHSEAKQKLTSALTTSTTSGKLVASQHEANLTNLTSPSHFQFSPNTSVITDTSNMFMVTVISAPIYSISIVLHIYGQNSANRDLISSVTMILIAFSALIGIFLPILLQIHRFNSLVHDRLPGTLSKPVITQSKLTQQDNIVSPLSPTSNAAFTMFPEFAPTGLRRPSSTSGESSSGCGSRRPFAETKESRRNMGVALANLGPSADSLRSMGFYKSDRHDDLNSDEPIDPALLNMQLNLNPNDELIPVLVDADAYNSSKHHHHQYQQQQASEKQPPPPSHHPRRTSKNEKRLIMLDVDPCCPRHGIAATRQPRTNETSQACKGVKQRSSHCHQ